jgi:LPS export ABC transporter protein LptC
MNVTIPDRSGHVVQNVMNVIAFFSLVTIFSCVNNDDEVKALVNRRTEVDEGVNIEAFMSNTGKMKAKLTAPLMLRYQDSSSKVVFPKTLHVDFFNDTTGIQSRMDANYGEYFEVKAKVFLKDSVRVSNNMGDTLFCQELWWDQNSQIFSTDKPVRIHRPDMIMNGVGLSAPQDFKVFEMYKITNSTLRVKE